VADFGPYLDTVIDLLREEQPGSRDEVQRLKLEAARRHEVPKIPKNSRVLNALPEDERDRWRPVLAKKPTRSLSGVAVVTVQAPPERCPHGTCTFCPGGPRQGTAQSYTGKEPAARRADRHGFDAFDQARQRLEDLETNGHPVDKVDLIVQGGTFPARDPADQRAFLTDLYDALNSHGGPPERSSSLEEAQRRNEEAKARAIGLTLETKPDWCKPEHVDRMLDLGTTRVEIGVQTVFDDVLERTNRGHTVEGSYKASQVARDAGLKVCYHLMPGLPGSTPERDLETARRVFEDPRLRPDMLKIYPTLVVPGTALHEQWKGGEYEPLDENEASAIVSAMLAELPPWVRVQRVERDIPTHEIADGVLKTNLRELAWEAMDQPCRCLRCREAPRKASDPLDLEPTERRYEASGGEEVFLAVEDPDQDAVVGYCRVRLPSEAAHRPEVEGRAIVRELKVVGAEVPVGGDAEQADALQHQGHGRELMRRAERAAREAGYDELLVTSGIGTRPYYRKLGYQRVGPYVGTRLDA
jgi:elongator complex protein 3